jgi:hypothetical protein
MVLGLCVVSSNTYLASKKIARKCLLLLTSTVSLFLAGTFAFKLIIVEIFECGFLPPRDSLGFGYMEVRIDEIPVEVGKQITYLYQFHQGRSMSSFGTM